MLDKLNVNENADFKQPNVFKKFILHEDPEKYILPLNPFKLNERSGQQQSLFLCPWDIRCSFIDNLRGMAAIDIKSANIKRFIIKADSQAKGVAFKKMKKMNISDETLFPGLDGYCRSLQDYFYTGIDFNDKQSKLNAACNDEAF